MKRTVHTRRFNNPKEGNANLTRGDLDKVAVGASDAGGLGASSLIGSLGVLDGIALSDRAEAVGVDADEGIRYTRSRVSSK